MNDFNSTLNIPDTGNAFGVDMPVEISDSVKDYVQTLKKNQVPNYEADFMMVCADDVEDLKEKCNCLNYVRYDGMLWIVLPDDVDFETVMKNDDCHQMMNDLNIKNVDSRHLENGYTAFRFRPLERASRS